MQPAALGERQQAIDDVLGYGVAKYEGRRLVRSQEIPRDESVESPFDVRDRWRAGEHVPERARVERLPNSARRFENKLVLDQEGVDASDDRAFEAGWNGQLRGRLHERRISCAVATQLLYDVRFAQR